MNKILTSDIINLIDGEYELNVKSDKLDINVDGNVKIYIINEKLNTVNINLYDNSKLDVYVFEKSVNNLIVFNINQSNKTKFNFNITIINNEKSEIIVNNNIVGNDNESLIKGRIVSNNELIRLVINVLVEKNTFNNIALEDLKGINNGGFVHIEPNIVCLSNEVSANHLTTIGSFNKDILNYLMSKGIEINKAKELLLKGFIYSNMDEYIKNLEVNDA